MTQQTQTRRRKLPADVYYTRRGGGLYVRWDGRPEGAVYYTADPDVAYGIGPEYPEADPQAGMTDDGWGMTPYQGAHGACYASRVVRMAADYAAGQR